MMLQVKQRNVLLVFFCLGICFTRDETVCQETDEEHQRSAVYCRDGISIYFVLQSTDYSHETNPIVRTNPHLSSLMYYKGQMESCLIDRNNPLRVELDPLTHVYNVGILSISLNETIGEALELKIVRDEASNRSIQFNCPFSSSNTAHFYYSCKDSEGQLNDAGVLVNAIEISPIDEMNMIKLNFNAIINSTWIFVNQNTHVESRRINTPNKRNKQQCLRPGHYITQQLSIIKDKQYFDEGEAVEYCCNDENNCNNRRMCMSNGRWTESIPRCLPKDLARWNLIRETTLNFTQKENKAEIHYSDGDYSLLTTINVILPLKICSENFWSWNSKSYRVPRAGASISFESDAWQQQDPGIDWILSSQIPSWLNGNCVITYERMNLTTNSTEPAVCSQCNITVRVRGNRSLLPTFYGQISIIAKSPSALETYDWMANGCPPIDPYLGMPQEYTNEVSRDPEILNKKLQEKPCKDGYRLVRNGTIGCHHGIWSGDVPKCRSITCVNPPEVKNAQLILLKIKSVPYNKVRYTCHEPFVLKGEEVAKCNELMNMWEGVPSCQMITTAEPDTTSAASQAAVTTPKTIASEPNNLKQHQLTFTLIVVILLLLLLLVVSLTGAMLIYRKKMKNNETDKRAPTSSNASNATQETISQTNLHITNNMQQAIYSNIPLPNSVPYCGEIGYLQSIREARNQPNHEYCEIHNNFIKPRPRHVYDDVTYIVGQNRIAL